MLRVATNAHARQLFAKAQWRGPLSTTEFRVLMCLSQVQAGTITVTRVWAQIFWNEHFQWLERDWRVALVPILARSSSQTAVSITSVSYLIYYTLVTPGPGTYIAPSAFGVYVGEKALVEAGSSFTSNKSSTKQRFLRSPSSIFGNNHSNLVERRKKLASS